MQEQPLLEEFQRALKEKTLRVVQKAKAAVDENIILKYRIEMLTMENQRINRELALERERQKTRVT